MTISNNKLSSLLCLEITILLMLGMSWTGGAQLPSSMVGYWAGFPSTTPLGPFGSAQFNFSIQTRNQNSSEWLMSDMFDNNFEFIRLSQQQFWVNEGEGVKYCGVVRGFYGLAAPIDVNFYQSIISDTQIQWCGVGYSCSEVSWTLTLENDNTLNSHVVIANPVVHLNVTMNRITSDDGADEVIYDVKIPHISMTPPCNLTVYPNPRPLPNSRDAENNREKEAVAQKKKLGCPLAFVSSFFNHDNDDVVIIADDDDEKKEDTKQISEEEKTYQYCYVLNPEVGFNLYWNIDVSSEILEVAVELTPHDANPKDYWLALGFQPEFPGMIGADIALGYLLSNSSCVRSMYSPNYVGTPVDDDSMVINATNVYVDSTTLTVAFSRSFNTGHHNISISYEGTHFEGVYYFMIMWAFGEAPSSCSASPSYHGNNRGVRMIDWYNPSRVFPSYMKCPNY